MKARERIHPMRSRAFRCSPRRVNTPAMATERTCTEMVHEADLAHEAGRFIEHGTRRHVAFTVLEELLRAERGHEVTFTLTISREPHVAGLFGFTATGYVVEPGPSHSTTEEPGGVCVSDHSSSPLPSRQE
jgi:hypothetical protein